MKMHKFQSFPLACRFPRLFCSVRENVSENDYAETVIRNLHNFGTLFRAGVLPAAAKGMRRISDLCQCYVNLHLPCDATSDPSWKAKALFRGGVLDSILMFCCLVLTVPNVNFPQVSFRLLPRAFVCFGSLNWCWLNIHALFTIDRCFAVVDCNEQTLRNLKDNFITRHPIEMDEKSLRKCENIIKSFKYVGTSRYLKLPQMYIAYWYHMCHGSISNK